MNVQSRSITILRCSALIAWTLLLVAGRASAAIDFSPTWRIPTYQEVRSQVKDWLAAAEVNEQTRLAASWHWEPVANGDREILDRLVDTFAAAYPQANQLRKACHESFGGPTPPEAAWLADDRIPPFVRNNVRLYYARWLADHRLYDESLSQLNGLQPVDVVDPAALLFYRMASNQQLVRPDEARAALVQLLERESELPERYRQVAKLLEADLATVEEDSLDHIARRMNDIRRRLGYGRAGSIVQDIENGVVKSLDKKIEEAEKQQQQAQQQSGSGGNAQPSRPMNDSQIAELKAPGRVDNKNIGRDSGWGDLPPKEREQALQQIGREFPAHYRELIEDYFKELANRPGPHP